MNEHATPEEETPPEAAAAEAPEGHAPQAEVPESEAPVVEAATSDAEQQDGEAPDAEARGAEASTPEALADNALDIPHVKRVLEAALLSTPDPLTVQQLKRLFGGEIAADNIRKVLDELKDEWADKAIELTSVATGWRFRVKPDYQPFLDRITNEKPPRYSRAVLETLAIIAYRQPVTRGDIEDIRGVAVSPATLNALMERGWIDEIGHRETPGRPAIFATSKKFLDDLNLRSLEELPALDELQSALESVQPAVDVTPQPEQQPLITDDTSTEPHHAG